MATIGNLFTLQDWARRTKDGKVDAIVEMQTQVNEVLLDALWQPTNMTMAEKTTIRTGLPEVVWRQINKGVPVGKSQTKQIEFGCGTIEARGEIDEEIVELAEDGAAIRISENEPFIESISQELAKTIFYGNVEKNPDRFTGLAAYYSSLSADSGANIVDAGGTSTDNTSIYIVCWGPNTIKGLFPKASKAGVYHEAIPGKIDLTDADGNKYRGYGDVFKQRAGLAVRDWRYGGRIANIDVSDLATAGAGTDTSANLVRLMIQLLNKLPNLNKGNVALYCNKEVKTAIDIQAMNNTKNSTLTIEQIKSGDQIINTTKFLGIPVRRCDQIINTEARVV